MKKCLLLWFSFLPIILFAQEESNIWMFGSSNAIHFTAAGPVFGGVPGAGSNWLNGHEFFRSNAVCDASGQLLFYVIIDCNAVVSTTALNQELNIFDASGQPIANSNLIVSTPVNGQIHILKKPGNNSVYYIVYGLNGGLFYTGVDMSLNNGIGGVIATEKSIMLSGWQTVVGEKTAIVQGCDGLWVVVRSRNQNQYLSFKVTEAGVSLNPVISVSGLFPLEDYVYGTIGPVGGSSSESNKAGFAGLLKVSPDNRTLVACTDGGLELYDFSLCSGRLSNPRIIDTTGMYDAGYITIGGYHIEPSQASYYSACFSPDGSKLYATYMFGRYVYQFDLNQPDAQAIMASKTTILGNQPMKVMDWQCVAVDTSGMGDLKLGPNGKIYIGNNATAGCSMDTMFVQSPALHVINNPNQLGMACNAQWNILTLPGITSVDFNPAIVMPPPPRDTLTSIRQISLCFSGLLQVDMPGDCYEWNTGSDSSSTRVDTPGQYVVCWSGEACTYHIDTFQVHMVQLPQLFVTKNSCENISNGQVYIHNAEGDSTTFNYRWKDANGWILRTITSNRSDTFYTGPGSYFLQISTWAGCDTTLSFTVDTLPMPALPYLADTALCRGKYILFHTSADATETHWVFGDGNFSTEQNPLYAFGKAGTYYMAVVVTNASGCSDTTDAEIQVNDLNLYLNANPEVTERGEEVELNTSADRSYTISTWGPFSLFPEQNSKRQRIYPNGRMVIFVKGISDEGCMDTASVTVYVRPEVMMPTAFSPNGDGLNDRFTPFSSGMGYKVSTFQIFNRLGQIVYDGFGDAAMQGWNGTYKGKPVDAGTYFYRITVSTEYGELMEQKGDVTVIR